MAGAIVFSLSVGIALVVDISLRNHTKLLEIVTQKILKMDLKRPMKTMRPIKKIPPTGIKLDLVTS